MISSVGRSRLALFAIPLTVGLMLAAPVRAQSAQDDRSDDNLSEIIVTSMRVRQGGAQDVRHFRAIAAEGGMPRPESLTVEGLMGEHDLAIEAGHCTQLLCLATEAMPAALPTRPDDRLFVGLAFGSNVDAATWRRAPLNLVAVIDKSGSMSGTPLDLVRKSLRQIVGQMRDGDRISIILYGDRSHVHLAPTDIAGGREMVLAAIGAIVSSGSTNMEAGLRVGYDTAFADAASFKGSTRLMLFTDEQPNVGFTGADSFMGMAQAASQRGIGLTTIGVGQQFGAALATRISSVRGGNLFFIGNEEEVKGVFEKQLDTMVSELAHDVRIVMTPQAGYVISGVFGVPDGVMGEAPDGAISITVPTAFVSTHGGGIFVSLGKARGLTHLPAASLSPDVPLMRVELTYVDATGKAAGSDTLTVAAPGGTPSKPLRLAHLLVDEYLAMTDATIAFHRNNDPKAAHALLSGLAGRIDATGLDGLNDERKLVAEMTTKAAFYAGYAGELPKSLRHIAVLGDWRIVDAEGFEDLHRGDRVSFTSDEAFVVTRVNPRRGEADQDNEAYQINEKQIHLPDSGIVMSYRATPDRLYLARDDTRGPLRLVLKRLATGTQD